MAKWNERTPEEQRAREIALHRENAKRHAEWVAALPKSEKDALTAIGKKQAAERDRLRKAQDKLLKLAEARNLDEKLQIIDHPSAPRLCDLRPYIWPQWEQAIEQAILELERR